MLGSRIAALRQESGWSQAQLAKRLHISPSAVGMYEQGRREPCVDTLIEMAKTFDVSLDYLLSGQPDTAQDVSALQKICGTYYETAQQLDGGVTREEMVVRLLCALLD